MVCAHSANSSLKASRISTTFPATKFVRISASTLSSRTFSFKKSRMFDDESISMLGDAVDLARGVSPQVESSAATPPRRAASSMSRMVLHDHSFTYHTPCLLCICLQSSPSPSS
mmetsp:Transcript_27413/g.65190  ORF Transcript_27413/g.65190 Transcript_27413/m.65190 type:complete len:114 (+) Transcript_27413:1752-2093(+)